MKKILICENNHDFAYSILWHLKDKGHDAILTTTGAEAIIAYTDHSPDVVLLDIHLDDDIDGKEVARRIKHIDKKTPIIFMSGESKTPQDVVECFKIGCDFFLKKPVTIAELEVHLEKCFENNDDHSYFQLGKTTYNVIERSIRYGSLRQYLSDKENRVLETLAVNCGETVTQSDILMRVWNNDYSDESLRNMISSIRKKLLYTDLTIITLKGIGYRLECIQEEG